MSDRLGASVRDHDLVWQAAFLVAPDRSVDRKRVVLRDAFDDRDVLLANPAFSKGPFEVLRSCLVVNEKQATAGAVVESVRGCLAGQCGNVRAGAPGASARIDQSPGPIYDADGHGEDSWRFGRAMYAAGLRPGDIIHNTFSYHLTPAGRMVESGAHALADGGDSTP